MISQKKTVVVGMSGGVDSSVSALLLKEQGYEVIGMFMKNWEEKDNLGRCLSAIEYEDVVRVCEQIEIPYYSVNFVKEYWDSVFVNFLNEFKQGHTPNPDILCNREIKFKVLLEKAIATGGDYLATGHYCRKSFDQGEWKLLKGIDPGKDQSYFLYTLSQQVLSRVLFPIGDMLKTDLRILARKHQLATFQKKDSTGICFIGKRNFKEFLSTYLSYTPGDFQTLEGKIMGQHEGAAYYTPGQRKGMGIGGAGDAWFVVGKDIEKNKVFIAQGQRHEALYCDELTATEASFVSGNPPTTFPFHCKSKVRYRQEDQECEIVSIENGRLHVKFSIPQRAVTSRQSIVFYDKNICLGGAMIEMPGLSYYEQGRALPKNISL